MVFFGTVRGEGEGEDFSISSTATWSLSKWMSVLTFIDNINGSKEGGPIYISSWDIAVPLTLVKKPTVLGSQFKITIENFLRRESMKVKFRPGGVSPTNLKGQFESSPRRGTPPTEMAYSTCFSTASKRDWVYSIGQLDEGT